MDWKLSTIAFQRPVVSGGEFVHRAPTAVVKWLARTRTGCLASRLRLFTHKMTGIVSSSCPCCGAADESEEHMVCLCPQTGPSDWQVVFMAAWAAAANSVSIQPPLRLLPCLGLSSVAFPLGPP